MFKLDNTASNKIMKEKYGQFMPFVTYINFDNFSFHQQVFDLRIFGKAPNNAGSIK